ncbi:MAG: hypothetical protein C0399_04780 [Syntrophus sp. (in: bacteria)]|nr:hypothetical protein [Syntrophus sp. (in: bacteria)]
MKRMLMMIVVIILLTGCAGLPRMNTSSGRPEITICGVGKSEIMEKVVAGFIMAGFNIRNTSNFQIVMGKPVSNPLVGAMMGSRYDSTPESRLVWTFASLDNNCTHIGVVVQIVTNPGSAFERITDVSTGKDGHEIQEEFERLKARVEGVNSGRSEGPSQTTTMKEQIKQKRQEEIRRGIENMRERMEEDKTLSEKGDVEAQKRITYYEERIRILEADYNK